MYRLILVVAFLLGSIVGFSQENRTNIAGVYQGKTLFIQNPYDRESRTFCVEQVLVNGEPIALNYKLSALKLDFDGLDLNTPVNIAIIHSDTICRPTIINSEAILFHTIFRFTKISLSDSALSWSTKGERGKGSFEVERLESGLWRVQEEMEASGNYESGEYAHFPYLEEGANKYRVKYYFPSGSRVSHLYSQEVEYDHYPEPVEFTPHRAQTRLFLSRPSLYEIYDANSELVLTGQGSEIDLTVLIQGQYVIYFNGRDPGTFVKE